MSQPAWADFFTAAQYQRFRQLVSDYFTQQNRSFDFGDGVIKVEDGDDGAKQQYGLMNLAQMCHRNDEAEWAEIIADHFRTMEKSQKEQKVLEQRIDDFSRVEELLAVRIWPEDYLDSLDRDKLLHRQDLPGTISALVFDLPSSVRNVTPEEAESWGKSTDELFTIGLANVKENCIPNISEEELGEGVRLTLFADESFFVASHALLLEEHPDAIGAFGALLGIPHRHVLLAYPIEDSRVLQAVQMMIPIIMGMERDGPGSISRRLYWYNQGDFTDLAYKLEGNTLNFAPPDDFVEMLNLLSDHDNDDE
ncbi:MAG: hypothetical protein L0Y72_28305 [Gemmataceae bacterium]|nr:hypothetical protein [Gemmataceae bacterium]MCI0742950.1 hypothetical protein [Gemmataceae bacterium]